MLALQAKDQSSVTRNQRRSCGWRYNATTSPRAERWRQTPGTHWTGSPAEGLCLKVMRREESTNEDSLMSTPDFAWIHICIYALAHTYTETYTQHTHIQGKTTTMCMHLTGSFPLDSPKTAARWTSGSHAIPVDSTRETIPESTLQLGRVGQSQCLSSAVVGSSSCQLSRAWEATIHLPPAVKIPFHNENPSE